MSGRNAMQSKMEGGKMIKFLEKLGRCSSINASGPADIRDRRERRILVYKSEEDFKL
jgi:hypothetical protein